MAVAFELNGQPFTALNGGPQSKLNESISFQINCETQHEVDHDWEKLPEGADNSARQCGWLKDKFGVSWQIVPAILPELLSGGDREGAQRAMKAMLQMKNLDIAKLKQVYTG
jgi:predicted 3-demethylubiquinone-9 3-methyltransferase (glyoxalase superfamily)